MNIAESVLEATLRPFRGMGFSLEEPDDHTVILRHGGEVVDKFTIYASIESIHNACKYHLVKEHNADEAVLSKDSG